MDLRVIGPGIVAALVLTGCSGGASAASNRRLITIEHSRFTPGHLVVERGSTVTFVVRNDDPIDHELIIGDEEVQLVHESGTHASHGAVPGEISVPAGETRTTTFTFSERGTLIYGCHLPQHYDYGMRGEIEVVG